MRSSDLKRSELENSVLYKIFFISTSDMRIRDLKRSELNSSVLYKIFFIFNFADMRNRDLKSS